MTVAFEIREIADEDLAEVAALLSEGFPSRTPDYWRTGLQRLGERECPPATEKYGYVLVTDQVLRGVILTIPSVHESGSERHVYVNISSWYVQRPFRGFPARELYRRASRREGITYTNLSAAAHTVKTIESFGFQKWTSGQMAAISLKWNRSSLQKNRILSWNDFGSVELPATEAKLLSDHQSFGCLTFCLATPNYLSPFIFVQRRVRGLIPCAQLIYCRELADLVQNGLAISSWLMMRGFPLMLVDASASIEGLIGRYYPDRGSKFFKGPRPLKEIDHTYSEMVLLGF